MQLVAVYSKHSLLEAGLKQLVGALGFHVSPLEQAEIALWELCTDGYPYPVPPPLPTLALIHTNSRHALEVLRLGYRGYLYEQVGPLQLKEALNAILRRELWAERHIIAKAFDTRSFGGFTPREREVLSLVMAGLSNKEIAQRLNLTENTVKGYVSKLLDKLGVRNRAGLILSQK